MRAWSEKAVAPLAARQRALVTYQQLIELGLTRGAIEHAQAEGRLHTMHRNVYAVVPPAALPPLAAEHAAVLACGQKALLSHASAASVWGLRSPHVREVHVSVVGRDAGRTRSGIRVHRVRDLDPYDTRIYHGLPITAPARTLLEIAPELNSREFERAFDEAIVKRLATPAAIRAMLARYPHRPGCGAIRDLLDPDRHTTRTRNEFEELMLSLVRKGGLPAPEVNATLGPYEVDFLWRRARVVVEADSYTFHSRRWAFERDRRKDADLIAAGYVVIRITWYQLEREPEVVLVRIAAALATRAAAA